MDSPITDLTHRKLVALLMFYLHSESRSVSKRQAVSELADTYQLVNGSGDLKPQYRALLDDLYSGMEGLVISNLIPLAAQQQQPQPQPQENH